MAAWLCVAEKSFTGIDTSPKEIVPEPMERALLRGAWTLVRTRAREWLLIKETGDAFVQRGGSFPDHPVLATEAAAARVRDELRTAGATRRKVHAAEIQLMLAEVRPRAFSDPEWIFELKYDGFRALAGRDDGRPVIQYRRGSDATGVHPDLAAALRALPVEHVVMDGEIVVLDGQGRPSFQRLQKRALLTAPRDLERSIRELPATLFFFDLLAFDDWDLRPLPLSERKRLLRLLLPDLGPLRYVDHFVGRGEEMFRGVRDLGLEGIMAKRAASPYRSGRSADWLKVRADRTADFAVVGFSAPEGSRVARGGAIEPGESVLAGGGIHERRFARVLPRDRAMALAVPARQARGADAVPGRHRRQVVLPEGRARLRPRLDPDRAHEERRGARHRSFRLRRRGDAPLRRQPRDNPAARVRGKGRRAAPGGLYRHRSGSEERSLRVGHPAGAGAARSVRGDRSALVLQDERAGGTARSLAARTAVHARAGARSGVGARERGRARAQGHRHPRARAHRGTPRPRLPELLPERLRQDDRGAVLRKAGAGRDGLHAFALERSEVRARSAGLHDRDRAAAAAKA